MYVVRFRVEMRGMAGSHTSVLPFGEGRSGRRGSILEWPILRQRERRAPHLSALGGGAMVYQDGDL
jgi:hypothetical protein